MFCKVELNPLWQQKKLREFCKANGILLTAYAPLGAQGTIWGSNRVLECELLKEIAKQKGKTVAQVHFALFVSSILLWKQLRTWDYLGLILCYSRKKFNSAAANRLGIENKKCWLVHPKTDLFEMGLRTRDRHIGEELQQGQDEKQPWDIQLVIESRGCEKDQWYPAKQAL